MDFHEHSNECLAALKCRGFLEQLNNCYMVKKDSASWS